MPLQQHLKYPDIKTDEGKKSAAMIDGLGFALERKYSDYKGQREEKEREWIKAIRQYEGNWDQDDLEKIERALSMTNNAHDPISVNITRPKTNVAIARMKDIQFPTGGDFNFTITPAPLSQEVKEALEQSEPDPQMQQVAAMQGGDPNAIPAPAQMAQEVVDQNTNGAPKMERALRNRMIYADYGRKARQAIEDLCILGTAVVKGPTIQNKKHVKYRPSTDEESGSKIQLLTEMWVPEPGLERVDPTMFFPDPSARLPWEIEDAIELHSFHKAGLRELARNPAFMADQIEKVLNYEPDDTEAPAIVEETRNDEGQTSKGRYWVKEYHGALDKQVLFDGGMITEEDLENNLKIFNGEIWICNKKVIRVSLSHIDGIQKLPYSLTVWETDSSSVFGHGVPYLLRNAQRVLNNAYLMMLDNASLSAGPQIVLNKEMIEPANVDDDYGIEGLKTWFLTEYGANVNEAMQFVDIPARIDEIGQIMDLAMQFADVESSIPQMQQGEVPVGNNTTTGMAMIMSASNITQKDASMNWDDFITRPTIERFYHYEMQYGEDDSIKGDYEIEIGGATERIEAQMKAQEIERMLGLAGSNEEFMDAVDSLKAFRALVDNTRTGDMLRSPEEVEQLKQERQQAQAQQQDPEMIKAQASLESAKADQMKAQADIQNAQIKARMDQMEAQAKYQLQMSEDQTQQMKYQLEYQLGIAQIAAQQGRTAAEIEKELQVADLEYKGKLQVAEIDWAKFEREVELKNQFGEGI